MSDSFTANINLRKPEVGAASDTWGGPAGLNGDLDLIDAIFAAGGDGTSVGINVGTGKTLNATGGTVSATADRFILRGATDATRQARFLVNSVPPGTTGNYSLPPVSDTLVGLTQAQTLTNKTMTAPTLNGATLSSPLMTGIPTAPTPATTVNNTQVATMAAVHAVVAAIPPPVLTIPQVVKVKKFAATGTYTPDANLVFATIEAWGGGGGGGGIDPPSTGSAAGGGGAGSYSRTTVAATTVGASQAVTIGAFGAGGASTGANGASGGDTSVGSLCVAKGGIGGTGCGPSVELIMAGGAGGVAGTGNLTEVGEPGQSGGSYSGGYPNGGQGGSSLLGGGGRSASGGTGGAFSLPGGDATGFGAGGGGAMAFGGTAQAGGKGSAGYVLITEHCTA